MNCDLIIINDYGHVTQDIKDLSEKSRLFLKKGPAYQSKLEFVYLLYYYHGLNRKTEVLDFLSYKENMEFFSYKYRNYEMS